MAKVAGNEVRPGMVIEFNGQLWSVVKTQSVKPGKGGAYNQCELKNIINGSKLNERFRSAEMVEEVQLERRDFQFLYASGDMLTFMDAQTYDQIELQTEFVGEDRAQFLQDGMKVIVQLHEGRPIGTDAAAAGRAARGRGRSGDQGADRGVVLQERGSGERRQDTGAAVHRSGHQGHRLHG